MTDGGPGAVEVVHDGSMVRATVTGRINVDHLAEIISRSVELEAEQPTKSMLIDFGPAERIDLAEDELFRIVASMRRRLRRAPDHRFAVVAPTETSSRFVTEFVGVRDLMAGAAVDVPPVRLFADLAGAEAWLAEPQV